MNRNQIEVNFGTQTVLTTPTDLARDIINSHIHPTALWIPQGIRAVVKDYYPEQHILRPVYFVVTEQPPAVRNISVNGTRYSVSLPYIINLFTLKQFFHEEAFGLELNRIWAFTFYRKMPLRGWDDELLLCNLPNVESKPWNENMSMATIGWTCFNNVPDNLKYVNSGVNRDGNIEEDVDVAVNHALSLVDYYLMSDFDLNSETSSCFYETAETIPEVSTFERWEEESTKNPQLAYELDWIKHPEDATLRDVIEAVRTATNCIRPDFGDYGDGGRLFTPTGKIPKRRLLALLRYRSTGKWF